MTNDRLSEATVWYLSPGDGNVELDGDAVLAEHYGAAEIRDLQNAIDDLIELSLVIGREFRNLEQIPAMEAVMDALRGEHPELSQAAIEALGRNWRYCNR
jgi:hypothetical protein